MINKIMLTIAIPTYNRVTKLRRLLKIIENQLEVFSESSQVKVIVSNNCSNDETKEFLDRFETSKFNFEYYDTHFQHLL